jgi:glycosidase
MILLAALTLLLAVETSHGVWWETTSVYEVYPRSFQDYDGDGIGDINGIRSRIDYFLELGIETLWLTPIFVSPMKDNGYDISDYIDIDPTFGTIDDFKMLVHEAHDKGGCAKLRIMLNVLQNAIKLF